LLSDSFIKYEAVPISINKIVHTIGKTTFEGVSGGWLSRLNEAIALRDISADTAPTASGIATDIINVLIFDCINITSIARLIKALPKDFALYGYYMHWCKKIIKRY
jgi:hypothetical protein